MICFSCLPGYFDTNCDMVPDICNDANPCIGADTVCVEDDGNATCQCSPGDALNTTNCPNDDLMLDSVADVSPPLNQRRDNVFVWPT